MLCSFSKACALTRSLSNHVATDVLHKGANMGKVRRTALVLLHHPDSKVHVLHDQQTDSKFSIASLCFVWGLMNEARSYHRFNFTPAHIHAICVLPSLAHVRVHLQIHTCTCTPTRAHNLYFCKWEADGNNEFLLCLQ